MGRGWPLGWFWEASPVQVAAFRREQGSADLDAVIARHLGDTDVVLTEGYKRGPYPKIEVHRSSRSDELLCGPDEMLALVTDRPWPIPVPQFNIDDAPAWRNSFSIGWRAPRRRAGVRRELVS